MHVCDSKSMVSSPAGLSKMNLIATSDPVTAFSYLLIDIVSHFKMKEQQLSKSANGIYQKRHLKFTALLYYSQSQIQVQMDFKNIHLTSNI